MKSTSRGAGRVEARGGPASWTRGGELRPSPEGPRGLRPETSRRVATDSCRGAALIASFVSGAVIGGQGPRCAGGRVVTPRIGPEGANRWRGWDPLRHRRETKAFPRMENRGGLVAHAPGGMPRRRCAAGRRSRSAPGRRARRGTTRRRAGRGRRPGDRSQRLLVFPTGCSARINTAAAAASRRAQDEREGGEPPLAVDQAVLGDLAGHDRLGDQDEEAHEVAAGAAGLEQLGEVVPEGLPLGLVRAVVAPGDGMTCWSGELTTAPTVQVARSRTGLAVSYSIRGIPNNGRPVLGRAARRDGVTGVAPRSHGTSFRSSPRRSRSTAEVCRREEKRPRSPGPGEFDRGVGSWVWTR